MPLLCLLLSLIIYLFFIVIFSLPLFTTPKLMVVPSPFILFAFSLVFHLVMKSRSFSCLSSSYFSPPFTPQPHLLWGVSLTNSFGV